MASFAPVTRVVTCKRCGEPQLAWVQNRKGKWYLTQTFVIGKEFVVESPARKWHVCFRWVVSNGQPENLFGKTRQDGI